MAYINVVIPVYNAEQYLLDTVRSVLDQPEKDIEIILVDDGSTDTSGKLCDEIAQIEERVSVVHKSNGGVSSARNVGIEYFLKTCKYGYIAFCDADDLWVPNTLSHTVTKEIKNEYADIVGFSMYSSNSNATRFCVTNKYEKNVIIKQKYEDKHLFGGSFAAHLYNIRLFMQNPVRFVEGCAHNEDVIFSAKMFFCSQTILNLDTFLYIYRKNYQSSTNMIRYSLENATLIPDSWEDASFFSDRLFVDDCVESNNWSKFCKTMSSIRCLEILKILSDMGYLQNEIEKVFMKKEYFHRIEYLHLDELAEWQRDHLIQYKTDRDRFYHSGRKCVHIFRNYLKACNIFRRVYDLKKYKLSLNEIRNK